MTEPRKIALVFLIIMAFGIVALIFEWLSELVGRMWLWLFAISFALLILALTIHYSHAHDHAQPEMNDWLAGLHSKNKTWCCKGDDTDAIEDWETKGDRYRVKFRGEWFDVPEDALVDGPNKGADALLWMNKGYLGMSVRCFMPGSMT